MRFKGSCLCGELNYEITGELNAAMLCHCGICRKSNGSAYAINIPVDRDKFVFTSGTETLKSFSSSSDANRYFCSACGSPLYSQRKSAPEIIRLRAGSLNNDVKIKKSCHIFVDSRANWDEIADDLPQFSERPK